MAQVPTGGNYVVDNSTGANVRADINEIFDAILTVNSGSTSPSYAKAYTLWADTNAGTMKIRNGANNAWIELFQLDGTLTLEDGSASTPALAFRDDLDTGIFSSAANNINFATGGVERLELSGSSTIFNESGADVNFRVEGDTDVNLFFIDAGQDRIGVNENAPIAKFHIKNADTSATSVSSNANELVIEDTGNCGMTIQSANDGVGNVYFGDVANGSVGRVSYDHSSNFMSFNTNAGERMRIDSSGRLLIGHSTNLHNLSLQVIGGTGDASSIALSRFSASSASPNLQFYKSRSNSIGTNTVLQNNDTVGIIRWNGADGTDYSQVADIQAAIDGTPGDNDTPGRLVFSTTADGSQYTTERMRIDSSGNVGIGTTTPDHVLDLGSSSAGRALTFSSFSNLFSEYSSGAFWLASNFYGNAGASGYKTGLTGNLGAAAISVNATGGSSSSGIIQFFTNSNASKTAGDAFTPTERMRLSSTGTLSIGTTDNSVATNNVQGISIDGANGYFAVNRTGNEAFGFGRTNDGQVGRFFRGGTNVGNITVGSSSTAYNTTMSDRSKKKNFEEWTEDTLEIFKNLNPQKFNFITENDFEKKTKGFIAQDLVDSFPEAYPVDDKDGKYWFNPSGMVVYLMKAIQELEAKVAALEAA